MNKIEQARRSIETAMARIGCPPGDNADADLYRDLQRSLAILKDMEGQEPVAAFGEDTDHICDLLMQLHGEFYGKDKAHADAFRALPKVVAFIKAHPSPSAPVDIAEIIAAGKLVVKAANEMERTLDAMSRALMLNERYNVDGGLDEGMNRIDIECSNAWTTATAKHRTA